MRKRPRRRKWKRWVFLLFFVACCGYGVYQWKGKPKDTRIAVSIVEVERKDLTQVVSGIGRIYPEVLVKISSEVAGEIIDLPAIEGQRVKKGDLLIHVNPEKFEAQLRQREAAVRAAEIASVQSKARLAQDELELKRQKQLLEKKFTSQQEVDRLVTNVEVGKANYEASLYRIEQEKTFLEEVRESLARTKVFAPMDGTIIKLSSEVGERVVGTGQFAGTEVMQLANLEQMEVRVNISELDIVHVHLQDRVKITVDAMPKKVFSGEVSSIGSSATEQNINNREQTADYEVKVRILDVMPELRPGMTAMIDIETKTVENVVVVPLQCITVRSTKDIPEAFKDKGKSKGEPEEESSKDRESDTEEKTKRVVFVVENEKAIMRLVSTGISDMSDIEILSGLEEGMQVIKGPYSALTRELEHESAIREKEEKATKPKRSE